VAVLFTRKFLWNLISRENYWFDIFLEKIPVAIFSRKFL
jgi:hypothetical protein